LGVCIDFLLSWILDDMGMDGDDVEGMLDGLGGD
jgi:hypothetical protein